ncbi:DUF6600 domain-containing protein [Geobacter sp. AOG2]|uniref:DUF6600 domain-containing protein n=1 Tax=Geobacter sp. AOG2 TaxID=1566347 RepID=UPI001CC6CD91|nr:DUF6600 domain-containing protein [Geobacter sp. AOG2]GFE60389.1 FecR domain-containing protein [Geobacter sp. AOG2]
MRRMLWMVLMLLTIITPTWALAGVISPARVRLQVGDVYFRTPGDNDWLPVVVNTPLDEGDSVWCPDGSRLEIQLNDGSLVRLDGGSTMELLAVEEDFTQIHISSGNMYVHTAVNVKERSLQIDAEDTTVLPASRSRLRIDMLPNSEEDVSILKGSAYVEGNGSRTKVRAGEQIALLEEGHNELLALNPPDDWEHWNQERDRDMIRSSRSETYLPEEIRGYGGELDASGEWIRVPDYGMVWRPTVILADDWAPYRSGRWIWKGDDYVWISYESWGWIPYHYGRWISVSGRGWCWVPPRRGDVYWGPGYVGWYRTGDRVGWTPLAPGETYYGHRSYGRNSVNVNVTNVNVRNTTVIYRNSRARGGMTIVPQNDFLRGRTVSTPVGGRNAVPPPAAVSFGSPRIKPLRESRMPIIKTTPPRVAPPEMKRTAPQDLRQRFPRINPSAPTSTPATVKTPTATPAPVTTHSGRDRRNVPAVQPAVRATPTETRVPASPAPRATQTPRAPQTPQGSPALHAPQDRERRSAPPVVPPAGKAAPAVQTPSQNSTPANAGKNRQMTTPQAPPRKVWNVTGPEQRKEEKKTAPPAKGRTEDRREEPKKDRQ